MPDVNERMARAEVAVAAARAVLDARRTERDTDAADARVLERRLMRLLAASLDADELDPADALRLLPALRKISEQPL